MKNLRGDTMRIVIPGKPNSQKRHRTSEFKRKDGKKGVRRYDPSKNDKKNVRRFLLARRPDKPINVPVRININAFFRTPKSWSDKKRERHEGKYRPKKPDNDNIEKLYYDALTDTIIEDDRLIVDTRTRKFYSKKPCVVIKIKLLGNDENVTEDDLKHLEKQLPEREF